MRNILEADMENEQTDQNTTLIVPSEQLPEFITIVPISHRPLFPGMMIPLMLSGEKMLAAVKEILDSPARSAVSSC